MWVKKIILKRNEDGAYALLMPFLLTDKADYRIEHIFECRIRTFCMYLMQLNRLLLQ